MKLKNNNGKIPKNLIPEPTLRRLPTYLNLFKNLKANGVENVSSSHVAANFRMDSTLVAKDLSYTGIKGRTKVGYNVEELIETLIRFLDFQTNEKAFLFGVGNLGKALINYQGLKQYGLEIVAGFDTDNKITNTSINGVKIYNLDDFRDLSQKMSVRLGIITTPDSKAQDIADLMIAWGVKGIWNFTPQTIKVPENVIVENTSVYSDLAVILNKLNQ